MHIAQSPTRDQFPLSKKKIIKKTLSSVLAFVIAFGVFYVVIIVLIAANSTHGAASSIGYIGIATVVLLLILAVITVPVYAYQRWYFATYFYDLTNDYIIIRKGPITPREITIPYERVQDVYVDQDLLDRLLGIYDVHLSSATMSSGMQAHIDGVEKTAADGLRAKLLTTVSERISKHKAVAQQ